MFWASVIPTAIVLGRIVAEPGTPPPDVADSQLLLIKRQDVVVGCTPGDGGVMGDAAIDAPADAPAPDAGVADGGVGDAGVPDAGTSCEMIPGDAVTMIVQPNVSISADGTRFAVLLVTPSRPIVHLESDVFSDLELRTGPEIQTQTVEVPDRSLGTKCQSVDYGGCGGGWDSGGGSDDWWDPPPPPRDAGLGDGAVVEETIGPYQFVRAQPTTPAELAGWLDQLGYEYMQEDLDAAAPYIELGFHIVAIRVAADTSGPLTPVALTWAGSELRVPAALGRGSFASMVTVYIAADQKYVLPGATIRYAMQTGMGFLTRNQLVLDPNKPATSDPIAVHLDNNSYREVKVVKNEVRVPVEVPCDEDDGGGCCSDCSAQPRARLDYGVLALAVLVVLRRRRR